MIATALIAAALLIWLAAFIRNEIRELARQENNNSPY